MATHASRARAGRSRQRQSKWAGSTRRCTRTALVTAPFLSRQPASLPARSAPGSASHFAPGSAIAREQMTRFSTFILAVVMVSGGVSSAFAQAQPRYIVSPFAPFFNYGGRSAGPIVRTVVDFQSNYAPGTIFIYTTERPAPPHDRPRPT